MGRQRYNVIDMHFTRVPAQQVLRHQPAGSNLAARVYPVQAAGAADRTRGATDS
jgi:hypothetical protein